MDSSRSIINWSMMSGRVLSRARVRCGWNGIPLALAALWSGSMSITRPKKPFWFLENVLTVSPGDIMMLTPGANAANTGGQRGVGSDSLTRKSVS